MHTQKNMEVNMNNIDLKNKVVLVTGAAGFIGASLVQRLLLTPEPITVIGIDNINDYYDISIKMWRLEQITNLYNQRKSKNYNWTFINGDISDKDLLLNLFNSYKPSIVVNLAAQAGVRYSISNPDAYIQSNIIGFYNVLECCRHSYDNNQHGVEHLVYASSSSVYGGNKKIPFSTDDKVDNPVSLYAATKKSDELIANAYAKIYNIPSTGLRFFTVYGPAGRPDMAYFGFTDKMRTGKKIQIFNYGNCERDFTYIDDIVEGIIRVIQRAPERETGEDGLPIPPYKIYNIGAGHPVKLLTFVDILQQELVEYGVLPKSFSIEKNMELVAMQPGDVAITYADTRQLERDFNYCPQVDLKTGIQAFVKWYKCFYNC